MRRTGVLLLPKKFVIGFFLISAVLVAAGAAPGQTLPKRSLITEAVNENKLTLLRGNTHPLARPEFDRGPAPLSLPMNRVLLVLKRSPEQEAALANLLDQQQDKSSPEFHLWLTPESFGQQFGPSDEDIAVVTGWLNSHGFQSIKVAHGRVVIEFSGTAAQVQEAFHTTIHKYVVDGAEHWANASDPSIPSALIPVVAGVQTLHNFYLKPQFAQSDEKFTAKYISGSRPQFTSPNGLHAMMPADFATIYNLNPIYADGINAQGIVIGVVGRSNFIIQDVLSFWELAGLPLRGFAVLLNGPDPGDLGDGEEIEAVLDSSWSGAVAPNANIIPVVSASTNTTDGVNLSEVFIIDNNIANVMTESFGGCELNRTSAQATAISSLAEQAAAQGITYMVSSGDNGAEGCDNPQSPKATHPISVNILAATPFNVAVGGTQFSENGHDASYWNSTNNPTSLSSAKSYIPENVWNESCATNCGTSGANLFAGSGGVSIFFSKPSWQSGVSGIPSDGARDLPDVSLSAAGHDPYLICIQDSCSPDSQGLIHFAGISGTSASAPAFAGIMALVNHKTGDRQGQANYVLYRLAAQEKLSDCNASSQSGLPAGTCIFNDVTVGNNAVPGESGFGTSSAKYQSGIGYDLATGLGSVNGTNLINGWANARTAMSVTTLTIPTMGITHGQPVNFTINVAPNSGTGTPSGDVSLFMLGGSVVSEQTVGFFPLAAGSISSTTNQMPGGDYFVTAHYEGDGTFLPSDSPTIEVKYSPEKSSTAAAALTGTPPNFSLFTNGIYGTPVFFRATVTGTSGIGSPTGTVFFSDDGGAPIPQALLDKTGTALTSMPVTNLAVGQHSVVGTYFGDPSFQTSTAQPILLTITQASTMSVVQQNSSPILQGQPANILVVVNASGQGNGPTGSVALFDGNTQIGGPVVLIPNIGNPTAQSTASFQVSFSTPGTHVLTGKYTGDSNYTASTTPALSVNVVRLATVTVSSSRPTAPQGTNLTFTAAVAPAQGSGPVPTGVLIFTVDGNSFGAPVNLSNGQGQNSISTLPAGSFTVFVNYSGDNNFAPATGSTPQVVTPGPDFSISANPQTIIVPSPGRQGSTVLTFTAMNGFSGTFTLSSAACSGLPSESSCGFSPSTVALNNATTTAMTTLTISTMAPSSAMPRIAYRPQRIGPVTIVLVVALVALLLLNVSSSRRRWQTAFLAGLAVVILLGFSACGGGGGGGGPQNPGTPVGIDPNVVISFSAGGVSHSIPLTVNVQ